MRKAEQLTAAGTATTIRVQPGTYREEVVVGPSSTAAPLTVEATAPGVVISAADRWTGWTRRSDGFWSASWPHRWGASARPTGWPSVSPLLLRREVVVVNGSQLRQVLAMDALSKTPGSFLVDEAGARLLLNPPKGVEMSSARVDVGVRKAGLRARQRDNLTVRGFTFRHAVTEIQRGGGMVVDGGRNLVVEDSIFEQNNWSGLQLFNVNGAALRRNSMIDNGVAGLGAWRNRALVLEDNETSRNGRSRSAWADFSGWADGSKILHTHGLVVRRHVAVGNRGPGLWFDTDVTDLVVEDSLFAHNTRHGLFHEKNPGPAVFRNNRICRNGMVGFMQDKSNDTTLLRNRIFANGAEALGISGPNGPFAVTDWETGKQRTIRNERFTLRENVFSQGSERLVLNNLKADDWTHLKRTFVSDKNRWRSSHSGPYTVPGRWLTLDGWRADTGQDRSSTFDAPATLACARPVATPSPTTSSDRLAGALAPASVTTQLDVAAADQQVQKSMSVRSGTGTQVATLTLSRGTSVTVVVLDSAGRTLTSFTGGTGTQVDGTYSAGTYRYVVTAPSRTSARLVISAPPAG